MDASSDLGGFTKPLLQRWWVQGQHEHGHRGSPGHQQRVEPHLFHGPMMAVESVINVIICISETYRKRGMA